MCEKVHQATDVQRVPAELDCQLKGLKGRAQVAWDLEAAFNASTRGQHGVEGVASLFGYY
jgi:hypothetical protein